MGRFHRIALRRRRISSWRHRLVPCRAGAGNPGCGHLRVFVRDQPAFRLAAQRRHPLPDAGVPPVQPLLQRHPDRLADGRPAARQATAERMAGTPGRRAGFAGNCAPVDRDRADRRASSCLCRDSGVRAVAGAVWRAALPDGGGRQGSLASRKSSRIRRFLQVFNADFQYHRLVAVACDGVCLRHRRRFRGCAVLLAHPGRPVAGSQCRHRAGQWRRRAGRPARHAAGRRRRG